MLNKKYYLETGVLREISSYLCSNFVQRFCYTSIHSLCELLTDLKNDKEYNIKKNVLKNIFESNIDIKWCFPQNIILNSFGIENHYSIISKEEIVIINNIMQNSFDMNKFIHDVNLENSTIYEKICNYDLFYYKGFIDEKIRGYNEFRNIYGNAYNMKNIVWSIENDRNCLVFFINVTKMVLANNMSKDKININNINPCDLMKNYNGNLDMFIFAYAFYALLEIPNNQNIGKNKRNDFNDIFHLTYINNKNDIFVIKDKIFEKLLNKKYQKNTISIENFKCKIKKML